MNATLERLLEAARKRDFGPAERDEQRVSFAYGNAAQGDDSTKNSVRAASEIMAASDTKQAA